jgi:hypothetical protein
MDLDESRVSMFAGKNDLDAIIDVLDRIGAADDVTFKMTGDRVRVTIPESLVAPFKTQAGSIRFTLNG